MKETKYLPFTNPATGEIFGQVAGVDPDRAAQIVQEMRDVIPEWSVKPIRERIRILKKFQRILIDSVDDLTETMTKNTGKNRQDALAEVFMSVNIFDEYLKHAASWLKRRSVPRGYFFFKRCYVEQRPFGTVLVIAPWNYPFYLAMPPVLAALLAGNTVVLKPSEITAAVGAALDELFKCVPELSPYVRVVHGDGMTGAALVGAAPDYIYLTGSPQTGRAVMKTASENLVPVACELGGKDAVIILEDADLPQAAYWTVNGAFYNTGQTCIAASRVYVVEAVYDEFLRLVTEETRKLLIGFTTDKDSPYYLGPLTDPRQLKNLDRHIEDAVGKGARLVMGGNRKGMFLDPMVVVDTNHDMLLLKEETFGPVLPVLKVKDEDEAVRLANDSQFGLSGSVWSGDLKRAERVAGMLQTGTVVINDSLSQIAIPMLPFGGIKQSGYGRTHGKEGLLQFTRTFGVAVSTPPHSFDLAVVGRKPGHYQFLVSLMRLLFGLTVSQRWQGLTGLFSRGTGKQKSENRPVYNQTVKVRRKQ